MSVTPPIETLMLTYQNVERQALAKRKRLECVSVGEKGKVIIINEEMKGSSSEVEEIKIRKCRRKSHVGIIDEEMKGSNSEYYEIGIRKCR